MNIEGGSYIPRLKRMSSVGSAFDEMFFSQEDKELARMIRSKLSSGEIGVPEAHEKIEAIRARYHYSGGEDGSGYKAIPEQTPVYAGRYDAALQQAARETLQREPFSYDAESDPLYRKTREKHLAAGKQVMDDTVARISARTGGLASSYAAKAGQDAYLAYADKAEELLPQYEERAYRRYLQEGKDKQDAVELLRKLDAEDYGRWSDRETTQRQEEKDAQDRTYRYGKDALDATYREEKDAADAAYREKKDADAAENKKRETARQDVEKHLAAGGDWRALPMEMIESAGLSEAQLEQLAAGYRKTSASAAKTALQETIYKTGYRPTDEELADAGMTRREADQWASAYAVKLPQAKTGGSSGLRKKTTEDVTESASPYYDKVLKNAYEFNNLKDATDYIDRMMNAGYITEEERRRILLMEFGQTLNEPTGAQRFDAAMDDISFFLRRGDQASAESAVFDLERKGMTEEQSERVKKLFRQFGIKQ